jgi:hypothetical protein
VVNVLEVLLAEIDELNADLASDLIVGRSRDADAAGLCDALKACRGVNAVAKDVMGFDDDIANIDAHAESNAPVFHLAYCKFINAGLELYSSSDRFDRARKLGQKPVARVLHDAAAVFRDGGLDSADWSAVSPLRHSA